MHKVSFRKDRVAKLLIKAISQILDGKRGFLGLPLLTVAYIKMSNDLKIANIYFSFYSTESDEIHNPQEIAAILNDKSPILRRELSSLVYLKSLPELRFHHDQHLEQGNKILDIIETIKH